MDLTYTDSEHKELGVLHNYYCDFDVADTMDYTIRVGINNNKMKGGYYWFIPETEFGGRIDKYKVIEETKEIEYYGRSIRGLLTSKVIEPPRGQDYKIINGNVAEAIREIISDVGYSEMFVVEESALVINNYKLKRYTTVYNAINDICFVCGYIPSFICDMDGVVHISFSEPVDYSDENEYTVDDIGFTIEKSYANVNHLICLGQGELKDRTVVHLYVDENGNIVETQYYYGEDEISEVYDYPNAATEDELKAYGIQRLKELSNSDSFTVTLTKDKKLNIGDIIGGVERITDTYVASKITNIIATIKDDTIKLEYTVGSDDTSSGKSASSRSSSDNKLYTNDSIQVVTTQVTNVYNTVNKVVEVVEVVAEEVETLKADMITVDTLDANVANINTLNADDAIIQNIFSESIISDSAILERLQANIISADKIDAIEAIVETAVIENLSTDFLKADSASLGQLMADSGLIENLVVTENAKILGTLKGLTIKGDVIEANTISAKSLIIREDDEHGDYKNGLIYQINATASGLDATELSKEEYREKISGQDLIAQSVTADRIDVEDLFAKDIMATGTITGASLYGSYGELIEGYIGGEEQGFRITENGLIGVKKEVTYLHNGNLIRGYCEFGKYLKGTYTVQSTLTVNSIHIVFPDSNYKDITDLFADYITTELFMKYSSNEEFMDIYELVDVTFKDYSSFTQYSDFTTFVKNEFGVSDATDDCLIEIDCSVRLDLFDENNNLVNRKYCDFQYNSVSLNDDLIGLSSKKHISTKEETGNVFRFDGIETDNILVTGGIIEGLEMLKSKTIYENGTALYEKYAPKSHSHDYLPLSGGTLTGSINMGSGNLRIGQESNNLYLGNAINKGWLLMQDAKSQETNCGWVLHQAGSMEILNHLTVGTITAQNIYTVGVNGTLNATTIYENGTILSSKYIPNSNKYIVNGVSHTGYFDIDQSKVPTLNFLSFWNGAHTSNGNSNLSYCNRGAFGTIVTKNTGDYLPSVGGTLTGELIVAVGNYKTNYGSRVIASNLYGNDTTGDYYMEFRYGSSAKSYYTRLHPAVVTANRYVYLPNAGGTLAIASSDIRLKDNVNDTEVKNAIDVIKQIKLRSFDWNDGSHPHQKIGFVADELEEIDSRLAVGGGWDIATDIEGNEEKVMNVKTVDTFYMMGYVVKAIQELSEQIQELKDA